MYTKATEERTARALVLERLIAVPIAVEGQKPNTTHTLCLWQVLQPTQAACELIGSEAAFGGAQIAPKRLEAARWSGSHGIDFVLQLTEVRDGDVSTVATMAWTSGTVSFLEFPCELTAYGVELHRIRGVWPLPSPPKHADKFEHYGKRLRSTITGLINASRYPLDSTEPADRVAAVNMTIVASMQGEMDDWLLTDKPVTGTEVVRFCHTPPESIAPRARLARLINIFRRDAPIPADLRPKYAKTASFDSDIETL